MARLPRLFVEGYPLHIIQRGNNRQACFHRPADYAFYLQKLQEASTKFEVDIHAFVLMTNHAHLLATPRCKSGASKMMQSLGRQYVRYFNITHQRTGTLWEGRFKSSLVDSSRYFLTVSTYIELNPVRAGMVSNIGDYPWSSYRANGMGANISLLSPHSEYLALGKTKERRIFNYRRLINAGVCDSDVEEIRNCLNKEWVVGAEGIDGNTHGMRDRRVTRASWGGDRKSESYLANQVSLTP